MLRNLVLVGLASSLALLGQSGAANGSIRGVIKDPAGALAASASVRARNLSTGFERQTTSNTGGSFDIPLLPLGSYEVSVEATGFAAYRQTGVSVELDKAALLDINLQLAATQEAVTVQADASMLTTNTVDISGGLNQRSMENMPITSRNSFNLALFAPGLNGRRDDEFGNPTFSFGGMQRRAFLVDGIDNTQRGGPGRLGIFSPDTLLEVKVVHNAMAAEYGRTVGGIINMVTRGGSNEFHGAAITLVRRPGLIARPSLSATKPFQQWATYGGQIGGPVRRDKLFFFASAEYEPLDAPRAITISNANAQALGLPPQELGSAPFGQRFQTYMGRMDYQITSNNSLYARYSNFWTPSKFNTSGGTSPLSASNNFDDRNDTFASQWTSILNPSAVNELRVGFIRREFTRPPASGVVGPVIVISGVATLGSNTAANQYYREAQFDFVDTFNYRIGKHAWKFGLDIATIGVTSGDRLLTQYTFANLQQYLDAANKVPVTGTGRQTNYAQLIQEFGNNTAEHRTQSYNFFAQDDFRLAPNFTLSYGLRYEFLAYPSLPSSAPLAESREVPNDNNNIAPRFGFAWQPDSKTVVRGGYGLFYDTTNLRLISTAIRQNGALVRRYVVNGPDAAAPLYPAEFTAEPSIPGVKPSVTNFAGDFRTMYAHQSNIQVEREIIRNVSVTIGGQWYAGRRMPLSIDVNLGAPIRLLDDGRPVFSSANRPNVNFNQILQLQSVGNSSYYGGFVSVNKRFSAGFQVAASYTLGWAFNVNDSTGDTGSNVTDSTNIRRDYGFSSSDQRHRFVLQGVWEKWGFLIAPNVTLTSAFPITATQGTDLNGDGVNNDRPLFRGRNDVEGYGFREVNLRVSRFIPLGRERFRLEMIAEAENLLNSTNAACSTGGCTGAVINRFDAPDFRRITSAVNSRQIQLGGRLRF